MAHEHDLIIIGSGPGGYVAAIRAGQLGLKVAVVEKDPKFGGTCLHRGCIPTKALLHTASLLDEVRRSRDFGVEVSDPRLDLERAHAYKQGVVDKNAKGIEVLFKKNNVEAIHGRGRLTGPHEVLVEPEEGDSRTLTAENVLIATGSVPRELSVAPTDGRRVVNSDHLLQVPEVPESLVVVGSGAVGCEFASIFSSFGSRVILVEMLPRILPLEDAEVSKELDRAFRKRKIQIVTEATLSGVRIVDEGVEVKLKSNDMEESVSAEMLLIAVGRAPVTDDLGLDELGVERERGYIRVNELMQTSVPHIYAIGDVVDTPWLAHVASAEGILAVEKIAGQEARPLNYDHVPSVTYCEPEVGSVGLTEAEAKERGYDVAVGKFPFSALGKAVIEGKTQGFVKVVRETRYDELLGVHIIGPHATDLIAEACVALRVESTTEELFRAIHAHPTLAEGVAEAAHAAVGHAIHI
ncbi:MAG: dihydrolipoyl dehydrogenase [Thermoanaerobaculia bacterium]|nr:dihydrolipoyl dehydrogenase [Thermoanaerobaculia bacterium]